MDYELGLYEALKVAFPSAALHGAPYHFAKNMYRYLASLPSALKRYRTEPAYAIKCKAVAAIAYIPVDCIDQALETLRKHLLPDLRFLVTWLQDIYVGRSRVLKRASQVMPTFFCKVSCCMWLGYNKGSRYYIPPRLIPKFNRKL